MGVLSDSWSNPSSMTLLPPYSSLPATRRFRLARLLLGGVIFCVVLAILGLPTQSRTIIGNLQGSSSFSVYNRTLGFQKVFAIGLPGRTDKRDALVLASSYSNFDITWSDGVAYEDIPEKAIPESFLENELIGTAIGCWRAHLNVLSRIVDEKIETALILEDDGDWDVNIKAQLEMFAKGSSQLQKDSPGVSPRASPYGNNWDMLWIGHCHSGPHDDAKSFYLIKNDSTVPPMPYRNGWWDNSHIIPEVLTNDTRIVFEAASGMCMWGYALSFEGARKILATMSLKGGDGRQIDVQLSDWARDKKIKIYSVYPPLFASHRFAGSKHRDSDIREKEADEIHPEFTKGVVYSAVINIPRLVSGAEDVLSQWPNDTVPVRRLDEKYTDQVTGELRRVDLQYFSEQVIPGVNAKGRLDMREYSTAIEEFEGDWQLAD